jgi:hypothetical protein
MQQNSSYAKNLAALEAETRLYETSAKRGAATVVTLPVVFHVVYNTSVQNISDAKIREQLDILNKDFRRLNWGVYHIPPVWQSLVADCEINFCLAQSDPDNLLTDGITRTQTGITSFGFDDKVKSSSQGGKDAWNVQKYINIWICPLASNVLGYTPYPGGDPSKEGVVLDYRVIGSGGPVMGADSGHTATHEMGHFFNLRHIWGDDMGCDSSDFVSDTPNQGGSSTGCPSFPQIDACTNSSPGTMFINFMDYSDDLCLKMFTTGQKTRMQAMLDPVTGYRKSLLTSNGCDFPVGLNETAKSRSRRIFYSAQPGVYQIYPVQDLLRVKCFDLLGRETETQPDANGTIDLSDRAPGIYIIQCLNASDELLYTGRVFR